MLGWLRNLLGGADEAEVDRLRQENEQLKAAAGALTVAGPLGSPFALLPDMGNDKERLKHFTGWSYSSIKAIAQAVAGQPIRVARKVKRSPRAAKGLEFEKAPAWVKQQPATLELLDAHPLLDVFADPNEAMIYWQLVFVLVASLELTGKGYLWLRDDDQGKLRLYPLPSPWVLAQHDDRLFARYTIMPPYGVPAFELTSEDVLRVYYPSPDSPVEAVAPLAKQGRAVSADESLQTAQSRAFTNGIHPGVLLTCGRHPDVQSMPGQRPILSKEQRAQLIAAIKAHFRGVAHYDEPLILDGLIESATRFTNTPQEMAFLESGKATKERITQGYGVNPVVMGQLEGSNRASALAAAEAFNDYTVNPKIALLSQVFTGWFSYRFQDPSLLVYIEECRTHDSDAERADWADLAKYGCVTRNEMRARVGLPPLPAGAGGDELVSPPASGGPGAAAGAGGEGKGPTLILSGRNGGS